MHRERIRLHVLMKDKQQLRRKAYDARNAQPDKEKLSGIICNKFIAQTAYQQAEIIMWYLHCRSEVRTLNAVVAALDSQKKIIIPTEVIITIVTKVINH